MKPRTFQSGRLVAALISSVPRPASYMWAVITIPCQRRLVRARAILSTVGAGALVSLHPLKKEAEVWCDRRGITSTGGAEVFFGSAGKSLLKCVRGEILIMG